MSNQEPQNKNKTTEETAVEKRRRFIKGAGIAAPVIMALANRPAFGAVCTVSGFISVDPGNVSAQGHVVSVCGGKLPSYWINNQDIWPSGYYPVPVIHTPPTPDTPATLMGGAFNFSGGLAASTLLSVLQGTGGTDTDSVYMYLTSALLNAASPSFGYSLTVAEIQDMYKQIFAGTYLAAPGVSWTGAQLAGFLTQTMS